MGAIIVNMMLQGGACHHCQCGHGVGLSMATWCGGVIIVMYGVSVIDMDRVCWKFQHHIVMHHNRM